MISDYEIAQNLVSLYQGGEGFDFYKPGADDTGICYALSLRSDENIIFFRGSKSLLDWARDLLVLPTLFPHETYGSVHAGFAIGLDRVAFEISTKVDFSKPTTITGHSLGAARAAILTAIFLETYQKDPKFLKRIVFGEPLSGFQQLADFIGAVETRSYRNGTSWHHDMVTDAPVRIPPLFNWVRASKLTYVSQPPDIPLIEEAIDPFAFHHMGLYTKALKGTP